MDWLSYAFNFVPWWLWLVGLLIAAIVTWQFWAPIWAVLPKPVKIALATVGAILAAYAAGRNRGSKDERDQRAKKDARAIQKRKETDDEIRNLPADDLDRRIDKWMRD